MRTVPSAGDLAHFLHNAAVIKVQNGWGGKKGKKLQHCLQLTSCSCLFQKYCGMKLYFRDNKMWRCHNKSEEKPGSSSTVQQGGSDCSPAAVLSCPDRCGRCRAAVSHHTDSRGCVLLRQLTLCFCKTATTSKTKTNQTTKTKYTENL